jgi:hypothetical protein
VTVKLLEEIIQKNYSHPLSQNDQRSFKAAFVLYVMTKFLAPQSLANYISTRYIHLKMRYVVSFENEVSGILKNDVPCILKMRYMVYFENDVPGILKMRYMVYLKMR